MYSLSSPPFHILIGVYFSHLKIYSPYSKIMVYCATLSLCVTRNDVTKAKMKLGIISLGVRWYGGDRISLHSRWHTLEVCPDHPSKVAVFLSLPPPHPMRFLSSYFALFSFIAFSQLDIIYFFIVWLPTLEWKLPRKEGFWLPAVCSTLRTVSGA